MTRTPLVGQGRSGRLLSALLEQKRIILSSSPLAEELVEHTANIVERNRDARETPASCRAPSNSCLPAVLP